jgi:hypothetical protein
MCLGLDSQQDNQQEWQLEWHVDETAARAVCNELLWGLDFAYFEEAPALATVHNTS